MNRRVLMLQTPAPRSVADLPRWSIRVSAQSSLSARRRSFPRRHAAARLPLLRRTGQPKHRPGARPRPLATNPTRQARPATHGQHRRHRLRPHCSLHRRQARLSSLTPRSSSRSAAPCASTLKRLPHDHGFFSHFNDIETGEPFRGSEISSIDTALLLCGVLTARAYFHDDAEIVQPRHHHLRARRLALDAQRRERPSPWAVRNGKFLDARWNHYCELMMLYLLAIGSPTHPIDPACWDAWSRPHMHYAGFDYISAADPLFVHQYSHAWFDFRNKRDRYADYFANSILATRAHQAFCLELGKPYSRRLLGHQRLRLRSTATRPGEALRSSGQRSAASTARSSPTPPPVRFPSFPHNACASSAPSKQLRRASLGTLRILRCLPPRPPTGTTPTSSASISASASSWPKTSAPASSGKPSSETPRSPSPCNGRLPRRLNDGKTP